MKICIYHGNCADGFAAAWVVHKALGDIEFFPGVYQESPPDVTNKDVVMVDFSYKRPVILEMAAKANSILIIDHHKTAIEDLVDLPNNVTLHTDMSASGCVLTWEHFFPTEEIPTLLLYISDRDLWEFKLPRSREINAAIFSYPYSFSEWYTLMEKDINSLIVEGTAIERKHFKDIKELLKVVTRSMVIGGHFIDVANLPYTYSSDAANILAKDCLFGACYWDTSSGRVFSLRSEKGGLDVSEIAKKYGGGGHKHASGFKVSYDIAKTFELDEIAKTLEIVI